MEISRKESFHMIPAPFDYHAPASLSEAIALLQRHGDQAKVLSGGQSLLPLLKLRVGAAGHLVDIGRIPGLEYIKEEDGFLKIGGRTREAAIERSDLIKTRYPILHDTALVIADPLVRNRATVGGNLAHADPSNDHPATMLALGAEVTATGPNGQRAIPIDQFFTGFYSTALAPDEILTEIRIPIPPAKSGGAYVKLERKVGDFATAAAAAQVTLGAGGDIERAGIGLTAAGPTPIKAQEAERFLLKKKPDAATLAEAARLAAGAASPTADRRGTVEYKREMARVLTTRALVKAVERAGGR
jgi:aerobic carbon-monoxide dehydrogenase medium subunit